MTGDSGAKTKEKTRPRDDFSAKVKDELAERVGFHCSYPGCPMITSGPKTGSRGSINLGVASHITAAAPGGPRYDPSLTAEQRASGDNGIWLCLIHSVLVDRDIAEDGVTPYTVDLLRRWKRDAEAAARARLEGRSPTPADQTTIHINPDRPPVAAIRDLLEAAFTDKKLLRFCKNQEEFQPVVKSFGSGDSLEDMVDELIDYCGTRLLWDTLLAEVAKVNKTQFDRFAPRLRV